MAEKSSKRVQGGEPNIKTPVGIRTRSYSAHRLYILSCANFRIADDPVAIVNTTALIVSNASLQLRVAQPSVRYTSSFAGGSRTSRRGVGFSLVTIRS